MTSIGRTRAPIALQLVALLVALNVLWEGYKLVQEAATGLMDAAWPEAEQQILQSVLEELRGEGADFHAVRTRVSAARRFADFHVLVPGEWSVQRGHDLVERIEQHIAARLLNVTVVAHLEPLDDPRSYEDGHL